jgi:Lipocalin-like domain
MPSSITRDYLAYFGRYWLDTETAVIHHQLEQQLFPGIYPDDLKRRYRFLDDKLLLEPLDEKDHEILRQPAIASGRGRLQRIYPD